MSVSIERARQLLTPPLPAPRVYTPDDAERFLGVRYTPEQRAVLATVPFSAETLRACAGTHLMVAGPGVSLSLRDVRDRRPTLFIARSRAWYDGKAETGWAAATVVEARWYLLRKEPLPGSLRKTYAEQQALLAEGEEVPTAGVVAYAVILHALVTGERLLPSVYVRCADRDSDGGRVIVGYLGQDGLYVYVYWDVSPGAHVGLAGARKF